MQAFYETLLLGEQALPGRERQLLSCPQELYCSSLSAAQPYVQEWSHCGSSGSSAESASSLRTAENHRTVSAAFTAAELNCDSNEECAQQRCWAWPLRRREPTWRFTHSMLSHTEAGHGFSAILLITAMFIRTQATMCWTHFLLQLLQQVGMQYLLKGWGYIHLLGVSWFFRAGINCLH